jgi:hypothetical protein
MNASTKFTHRRRRIVAGVASALLLSCGIAGFSAGTAAAATCSGSGCQGLDAKLQGCPVTSSKANGGGYGQIWNYYSQACKANWAEGDLLRPPGEYAGYSFYVVITTTDSNGNSESMCSPGPSNTGSPHEYCFDTPYSPGNGSPAWTDMVDGTNITQAYIYVYGPDGSLIETDEVDQ